MDILAVQIVGAALVVAVLFLEIWRTRRSEQIIGAWAKSNNYRLLEGRNISGQSQDSKRFFASPSEMPKVR